MHRYRYVSWLVSLGLLLGCGASDLATSPTTPEPQRLRVVTTMSILADFIRQVGGTRVSAENIIPVGAGPEEYQPTPQDARKVAEAAVVFFNGHGLENWLSDLFKNAGKPDLLRVELSGGLPALAPGAAEFTEGNPHFWLDPQHAQHYVTVIRDTLSHIDPAGAALYAANATTYLNQLTALDQELAQLAQTVPPAQRKIVTNHDAFPYFAQRYGFTVVGNILGNPEAELAAGDLAQLVRTIRAEQVKAVFSESQFSPKIAQALARDAGVAIIANLYTDTLGTNADTNSYLSMMRYNMRTIVGALTGQPQS